MKNIYYIGKEDLSFEALEWILKENIKVELSPEAKERIQKCRDYLNRKMENQTEPIYGITTDLFIVIEQFRTPTEYITGKFGEIAPLHWKK
jgi:histidine ammonia-lyase